MHRRVNLCKHGHQSRWPELSPLGGCYYILCLGIPSLLAGVGCNILDFEINLPCSGFDARLIGLQYLGSSQGRHSDDQNNFHWMQVPLPVVSISLLRSWLTAECREINKQRS